MSMGAIRLSMGGGALLALALQRAARRRGYPTWRACRCTFRTEPAFHLVLWGASTGRSDELLVLTFSAPPAPARRALHHGAQWGAVVQGWLRLGRAPYLLRVDLPGTARARTWLPLRPGGAPPRPERPGLKRLLLTARPDEDVGDGRALLRAFREPRSGRLVLKNCCASRTPAGTRVDCIGPALAQISYCTARLGSPAGAPSVHAAALPSGAPR